MITVGVAIPSRYHPKREVSLFRTILSLKSQGVRVLISVCFYEWPEDALARMTEFVHFTSIQDGTGRKGVAAARNIATQPLLDQNLDYIIHADDEITFHSGCLLEMAKLMEHPRVGCVVPLGADHFEVRKLYLEPESLVARRTFHVVACWAVKSVMPYPLTPQLISLGYLPDLGYDESMMMVEDKYMGIQVYIRGYECVVSTRAKVTNGRMNEGGCGDISKRQSQYAIDMEYLAKKYPGIVKTGQRRGKQFISISKGMKKSGFLRTDMFDIHDTSAGRITVTKKAAKR